MKAEVLLTQSDFRKYPFLPEAFKRVQALGISLLDLASTPMKDILERAAAYVKAAALASSLPPPADDADEEVLAYIVSLILLRLIGDRLLIRRFAVAYSRRVGSFLTNEETSKLIYILNSLGFKAKVIEKKTFGFAIAIDVFSYSEYAPERAGPWKLVHRLVENGWVYVSKYEAARLAEEALKKTMEKQALEMKVDELHVPDEVYSVVERLSSEWGARLKRIYESRGLLKVKDWEAAVPPCIRAIMEDVRAGKNIPHSARFALASFLLNIGLDVEEVLDVFRSAPDFREQVARYQVEHIAGLRGSRKKYTPYKCDNMKTLGLCVSDCGVKHPLQYYWKTARRLKKGEGRNHREG